MPIDAVKIPQNVQIEDRVVGPLSLRQIIIMAVGGGFSYMLYTMVQRSMGTMNIPLTVILWTPAAIAAAFALVNINDLSLLRICFLLLEKMQKPSLRTWAPRTGISITIRTSASVKTDDEAKKKQAAGPQQSAEQQITELTRVVDRPSVSAWPSRDGQATPTEEVTIPADVSAPSSKPPSASLGTGYPEPGPEKIPPAVRPNDIRVDSPSPAAPLLSDLSVFRDVLPPNASWPS